MRLTAQSQQAGSSAAITGRVIDADSGDPVSGANVTYTLVGSGRREGGPIQSAANGSFVIENLEPGSYGIRAVANGYENGYWGNMNATESFTALLPLQRGERAEIVIKMWRQGVISGSIAEQDGQPAVNLSVTALRKQQDGWVRAGGFTFSDDRGGYRLSLSPGEYLVLTPLGVPANARLAHSTYAPAELTSATARIVRVTSGAETAGVDMRVTIADTPDAGHQVAGRVRAPDGNAASLEVRLVPAGAGATAIYDVHAVWTEAQGYFSFSAIPSGDYTLQVVRFPEWPSSYEGKVYRLTAESGGGISWSISGPGPSVVGLGRAPGPSTMPDGLTFVAEIPVSVRDTDVASIDVPLIPAATIRGWLVFDGVDPPSPAALTSMSMLMVPSDSRVLPLVPEGRVMADGTFTSVGLPPGAYAVGVLRGLPSGWTLVSMQTATGQRIGRPIELGSTDTVVTLVFTRKVTELTGTVRDQQGRAATARVYIFPREREWRLSRRLALNNALVEQAQSGPSGVFTFNRVIPGDYLVAAVTDPPEEPSSTFLESLERTAVPVQIALGEKKSVEVRLSASLAR
jgi:uncharacterized protein (DUF2141 family)